MSKFSEIVASIEKYRLVVKSNDLVNSRQRFNAMQQRIILNALAMIDERKEYGEWIEIRLSIHDILGKAEGAKIGGREYRSVKEATIKLTESSVQMERVQPSGKIRWESISFISYATGEEGSDEVMIRFDPAMKPFLLNLKSNFTTYTLEQVHRFRKVYSIRIYELCKQYFPKITERKFLISEFKYLLTLENKYPYISDLVKSVLKPSLAEINSHSDLNIEYKLLPERSRSKKEIVFIIKANENYKAEYDPKSNLFQPVETEEHIAPESSKTIDIEPVELESNITKTPEVPVNPVQEAPTGSPEEDLTPPEKLPQWLSDANFANMARIGGKELVMFALGVIEAKDNIDNKMGYLYQGLKKGWFEEMFALHQQKQQEDRKEVEKREAEQARMAAQKQEEEHERIIKEVFGKHNYHQRLKMLELKDSENERFEYIYTLEFDPEYEGHKLHYLHEWLANTPSESALSLYSGWLLKKYGKQSDWDLKAFLSERGL